MLALFSFGASGSEKINIAAFYIPLMVESHEEGRFVELIREIDARIPQSIELTVFPARRAVALFRDGLIDGFLPALDVLMPEAYNRTTAIYVKRDFAFIRHSDKPVHSVKDLQGKVVGLTAGYPYRPDVVTSSHWVQYSRDDISNMKKLGQGRTDVFVVEEKTGLAALKLSGESHIVYSSDHPLSEQDVYIAFTNSDKGKRYAALFTRVLEQMKSDGHFDQIMNETINRN